MRVAILSDIHGNCVALDAVLKDLCRDSADQIVCLGDAIQGGPQPADVTARLRELGCPVVMGNADDWLLTGVELTRESMPEALMHVMNDVRLWSVAQLSEADRAFIAQFQPMVEIPLGKRSLLCFHGSPASYHDHIRPDTPEEEFMALLGDHAPCLMTGGHTHVSMIRRISASDRSFFNPGSVGNAYSYQHPEEGFRAYPLAEYMVLDVEGERVALDFRRVPFDADALVRVLRASGRPHIEGAIMQYECGYNQG